MKKSTAKKIGKDMKDRAEIKAQIAARVAPGPRKANVIKKVYKEGSPGYRRKRVGGVTLTQLKAAINEPSAKITYGIDADGQPTSEIISVEPTRDSAVVTKRRREMTGRELLGSSNIGSARRHVRDSYAACNSKGTKPAKKPWHRSGARTAAKAVSSKKGK